MSKQQKVRALQLALKDPDLRLGVCVALIGAEQADASLEYACDDLREYIHRVLEGHSTLEAWLDRFHPLRGQDWYFNHGHLSQADRMLTTRKAWINWMIACLQEGIDKGEA